MKKLTSDQVRNMWLEFFKSKQHFFVEPVSLIPSNDPSLLWINSGVATLKPYFEGTITPPSKRLTNSQNCIRTNDIENVGRTARHQTMFEMLGNFSIGDYFKKEAIEFAWELLTDKNWFAIEPDKLYVTIFEEDSDAYDIWTNTIKLSPDRIIKGNRDTNFWDIGQGPCGPNTEIFYDRGQKYDPENIGLKLLAEDIENDRYIEIWNIVFSQFSNNGKNEYSELPRKNIDTGAGLERIVSISQDVPTNFDSDLFIPIIKEIEKLASPNIKYDINSIFNSDLEQKAINTAYKVIADHIRTCVFSISDGAYPSNKDKGYVIRRLIRRSMVFARKLQINNAFMYKLVDCVIEKMKSFYPKLIKARDKVVEIILYEENKFLETLNKGFALINDLIDQKQNIEAKDCLLLFESFGFPIEIIEEIVIERNEQISDKSKHIKIDIDGFYSLLEKTREISRNSRKELAAWNPASNILENLKVRSEFVGYELNEIDTQVVYMFKDEKEIQSIENDFAYVVLDKTPFFATKGGQEHDLGIITNSNGDVFNVVDVNEGKNGQNVHKVIIKSKLSVGDTVKAKIDTDKRFYTAKNHSGTHILHSAIRQIMGEEYYQIGSFNNEEGLRIDINLNSVPDTNKLNQIEKLVQENIDKALVREVYNTDIDTAKNKYKAISLFGEKYKDVVRCVKFGDFSSELCGGTHVDSTSDIEELVLTKVESKGNGVVRFNAITSKKTISSFLEQQHTKIIESVKHQFNEFNQFKSEINKEDFDKLAVNEVESAIDKINSIKVDKHNFRTLPDLENNFRLAYKKFLSNYNDYQVDSIVKKFINLEPTKEEHFNTLKIVDDLISSNSIKKISDILQNKFENLVLHLVNERDKIYLVSVSKNIADKYKAIDIFKNVKDYKLKGGGNNLLAQGKIE